MGVTRKLARETWPEYFDALSKELLNSPVSVEIVGGPGPPLIEASHLALLALTYDRRDDVLEIAAARGGPHLPSVVRHMVNHPERVSVDSQTMLAPMTIAVDKPNAVRTMITIEHEPKITG